MIICLYFLRNKNYVQKVSSRNSTVYRFHMKIYFESFVSFIWNHLRKYFAQLEVIFCIFLLINASTGLIPWNYLPFLVLLCHYIR